MSTVANLLNQPPIFLRRVLVLDAVASGATGLLAIVASGFLSWLLNLPAGLLLGAGLMLVPYVLFVIYTATRPDIPHAAVWLIIIANALWALASVALLLSGLVSPNALGVAFVLAQAAVVALLGELQHVGMRRPLATA
jgi:hypothetical protein